MGQQEMRCFPPEAACTTHNVSKLYAPEEWILLHLTINIIPMSSLVGNKWSPSRLGQDVVHRD